MGRHRKPANPAHHGAAVFAAVWGCVVLPGLVVGGFALGGVTPQWPASDPAPHVSAQVQGVDMHGPCSTDALCAAWDAFVVEAGSTR